jgi:hypothetical protein
MTPNSDLENNFKHNDKIPEYRKFIIPVRDTKNSSSSNNFQQVKTSLQNENLSHNSESSGHYKTLTEKSSTVINNLCTDIASLVNVTSRGKDNICISSLTAADTVTESESRAQPGSIETIFGSDVVAVSTDIETQDTEHSCGESNAVVSVPEGTVKEKEEPINFITSPTLENGYEGVATAVESSFHRRSEMDEVEFDDVVRYGGCGNRYIPNCEPGDENVYENSNGNYEMCGQYNLNESYQTAKTEARPTQEQTTDQSRACNYHANGFVLNDSNNRPIDDSNVSTISNICSREEHYVGEHSDKSLSGMELSVKKTAEGADSVSSDLNSPARFCNYISPIDFERYANFDKCVQNSAFEYHQLTSSNDEEVQRNVDSPPNGYRVVDGTRRSSTVTSDGDSGKTKKPLVKLAKSIYFSEDSASDIYLSAGEALEAVLYARKLLSVLEHALDKALSSSTDRNNTGSSVSLSTKITRRKQRARSLSPNVLRRCNGTDSVCNETGIEICSDGAYCALGGDTGTSNTKGAHAKQTCGAKPIISGDGVFIRSCCYRDASPFLSLSPEQLRKQRALLKPATERRIRGDVVQMLDMADILRNAISRRRTFVDPTDEVICGTNRSVSEWSLEDS